jgi:drug/metabolite transporter (DMT)-like permease
MHKLSPRQWLILILLTLVWGVNWPVMKLGVMSYPPLTFRAIAIVLGLPVLALVLWLQKVPFRIPRAHWAELAWLALFNMILWHGLIILAVNALSSGRAAILGYTMPIFSAVIGAWFFGTALRARAWGGVAAAATGVVLLLWHELTDLSGKPMGVALALLAAAAWAVGTHRMRRTTLPVPTLTIVFWMTALTTVSMLLLSFLFERDQWKLPSPANWAAIAFNAVLVYGFAQSAWFYLARSLPPVASTLSVMLIPIVGVLTGAWWLGEVLHWQDWAAVALIIVAIASVLLPERSR